MEIPFSVHHHVLKVIQKITMQRLHSTEWVSELTEQGLTSPSTHYRSFRRRVFSVNHSHWYWQPNKNNRET